jgi:cytochrome c
MPSPKLAATLALCLGFLAAPLQADTDAYLLASADASKPDHDVTSHNTESQITNHNRAEEEGTPEYGTLFVARGVDTTFYTCSACHSEMIVAQQGLTRDGWEELLEWMVEEQGMSEIEEPDLSEILDYLAANYNVDRPNFPKPRN